MSHDPPTTDPSCPSDGGEPVEDLVSRVYEELRRLAGRQLRRERAGHTLQPTALINEAYLRLGAADLGDLTRTQFLALASRAMRRVLVDHSRRRASVKRGGGEWQRVTLHDPSNPSGGGEVDALALSDLLDELSKEDERTGQVVEFRVFGGLSFDEIARTLGTSTRTIERDWYFAKGWLAKHLRQAERG